MDAELRMFGLLMMWVFGMMTGYAIGRVSKDALSAPSRVPLATRPPKPDPLVDVSRRRRETRQHQAVRPMPEMFRSDAAVGGSE
jgi:hypothetical protein